MESVADILTLVNSGGVVVLLVVILQYMVTGKIVSRSVVRAIVVETVDRMLSELEKRGFLSEEENDT